MKFNTLILMTIIIFILFSNTIQRESTENNNLKSQRIDGRDDKKYQHTTRLMDGNKGSVYSLSLHSVDCLENLGPITRFHLWGSFGLFSNDLAFEYSCMENKVKSKNLLEKEYFESKNKVDTTNMKDSPKALINIDADCQENFLGQFKLKHNSKLYFTGYCIKLKQKKETCKTFRGGLTDTYWISSFLGETISNLDQLPVIAPKDTALVSFKMIKRIDDNISFQY